MLAWQKLAPRLGSDFIEFTELLFQAYEKFGVGVKAVRERLTKMQKSGNYNYIPGSDFSSNPDEFSFADGIGVAPKHRDDTLETVDMDLDDDGKCIWGGGRSGPSFGID